MDLSVLIPEIAILQTDQSGTIGKIAILADVKHFVRCAKFRKLSFWNISKIFIPSS